MQPTNISAKINDQVYANAILASLKNQTYAVDKFVCVKIKGKKIQVY